MASDLSALTVENNILVPLVGYLEEQHYQNIVQLTRNLISALPVNSVCSL